MNYSKKIIKQMLTIKDYIAITNFLSNEYVKKIKEPMNKETVHQKEMIYNLYCCSLFNATSAIAKSKYIFEDLVDDIEKFDSIINEEYEVKDIDFFQNAEYRNTLYKILQEKRNQYNHYEKDSNDDIVLFEFYVEFEQLEKLRKIINDLLDKKISQIPKKQIKDIILGKPKIICNLKKINRALEQYEKSLSGVNVDMEEIEDTKKMINIAKDIFDGNMMYDLLNGDENAMKKLDTYDNVLNEMNLKWKEKYNDKNNEKGVKAFEIIEQHFNIINNDNISLEENKDQIKKLFDELKKLYSYDESKN